MRRLSTRRDSARNDHEVSESARSACARLTSGGAGNFAISATRNRYSVRLSSLPSVTL